MNRRLFLNSLLGVAVGGAVAYSFPSIIVPKNIMLASFAEAILNSNPVAYWPLYNQAPNGLIFLLDDRARSLQGFQTILDARTIIKPFWKDIHSDIGITS